MNKLDAFMKKYAWPIVVIGTALVAFCIYKGVTEEMAEQERFAKTMRWYQNELKTVREEVCIVDPPTRYSFKRCEDTIRRLSVDQDVVGQFPTTMEIRLDDARLVTVPAVKLLYKLRPIHTPVVYPPYLIF